MYDIVVIYTNVCKIEHVPMYFYQSVVVQKRENATANIRTRNAGQSHDVTTNSQSIKYGRDVCFI